MGLQGQKPILRVLLAEPRGFCAGVVRAIRTVENALATYGAPVYVRHEIVHNAHVVRRLKAMGAVFVENVEDAPQGAPMVFSAHGVSTSVKEAAIQRGMVSIDATCPLVLKVHNEIRRHAAAGRHIILIGHANHPEVEGSLGQTPKSSISLIERIEDIAQLAPPTGPLAYATQTTLSVDETTAILSALKQRFPDIQGPRKDDICYATTNRQAAVKAIAADAEIFVVIGSPTSSNSRRLVDVALASGAIRAFLIDDTSQFQWEVIDNAESIGITAGASAPEDLVEDFLTEIALRRPIKVETISTTTENVVFKTPTLLAS